MKPLSQHIARDMGSVASPIGHGQLLETGNRASNLPELRPIGSHDLIGLSRLLAGFDKEDAYATSPAYYAITGRKGLWLYGDRDTFMLIAVHPNRDHHLLLFPPFGKTPVKLLETAIHDPRLSANNRQLARIGGEDMLLLAWGEATGFLAPVDEAVLDWVYPVHTVSTHRLVAQQGREFRNFRHGIHTAHRARTTSRPVETAVDRRAMVQIADQWAAICGHEGYNMDDLTAPTRMVVDLMQHSPLTIRAVLILQEGRPVGFHAWEETSPEVGLANSLCCIALSEMGAAEFAYLKMAEALVERGFTHVCIGGSETAGLDAFKRKMNPVQSTRLQSARIL